MMVQTKNALVSWRNLQPAVLTILFVLLSVVTTALSLPHQANNVSDYSYIIRIRIPPGQSSDFSANVGFRLAEGTKAASPFDDGKVKAILAPGVMDDVSAGVISIVHDQQSLSQSLDMRAKIQGNYLLVASADASFTLSSSISQSSTTTTVRAFRVNLFQQDTFKADEHPDSFLNALTDDARHMWDNDIDGFYKQYGTHVIYSIHKGCSGEFEGKYIFSDSQKANSFGSQMAAEGNVIDFSMSASARIDSSAKSEDSKYEFTVKSDDGSVDGSSLQEAVESFTKNFDECVSGGQGAIRMVTLKAWKEFFSNGGEPSPFSEESISKLSRINTILGMIQATNDNVQNQIKYNEGDWQKHLGTTVPPSKYKAYDTIQICSKEDGNTIFPFTGPQKSVLHGLNDITSSVEKIRSDGFLNGGQFTSKTTSMDVSAMINKYSMRVSNLVQQSVGQWLGVMSKFRINVLTPNIKEDGYSGDYDIAKPDDQLNRIRVGCYDPSTTTMHWIQEPSVLACDDKMPVGSVQLRVLTLQAVIAFKVKKDSGHFMSEETNCYPSTQCGANDFMFSWTFFDDAVPAQYPCDFQVAFS
eukprot:Nk52_evm14s168 gene=Nk52_evmTU14s168